MVSTPPKPTGCIIEEIDDWTAARTAGRTLGGLSRYFVAAFLIFWLCGWAVAWIAAATELIRGRPKGGDLFSIVWLGGSTIGGVFAFFMLYIVIRPLRPESLTLGFKLFRYDSGTASIAMFFNPWYAMHRYGGQWPFPGVFRRASELKSPRANSRQVVL